MEYCYGPEHGRKCVCGGLEEMCAICSKRISDCEWVCCWGTCNDCLDRSYSEYLKSKELECPECAAGNTPHELSHEGKP